MKKIFILVLFATIVSAKINIDTTYSTFGAVAKKIGGDKVKVTVLANPKYDPHFIVPKPSLLSKLHRADILIINGGGLELGWLPPLLRAANNAKINNGAKGLLDLSHHLPMIDIPTNVSRAFGDIHAQGNPHYTTDPHNITNIAKAIWQKLIKTDPDNKELYTKNYEKFQNNWQKYLQNYDLNMQNCHTKKVVQYHELFNYFFKRYNIKNYANIEPLPGIAPSSKHTIKLINIIKKNNIDKIVQDVYHEKKTAKFISSKTAVPVVVIPHDLGADGSKTLEEFYNNIAQKLCQ